MFFTLLCLPSTNDQVGGHPRRKRKATQAGMDMMDNCVCADEGCEEEITDDDLLRCDACKLAVC